MTPDPLPEQVWRNVLARAAELDATDGTTLPVEELRRAALEAGISESAFERALQEVPNESAVPEARAGMLKRLVGPTAAVGAFWASLSVLARAAFFMGAGWEVRAGVNLAALAIGIAVGKRLGARRTTAILAGVAASQGALLLIHLIWGIQSAQGLPVNWLAMVAGVGGALLATLRAPTPGHGSAPPNALPPIHTDQSGLPELESGDDPDHFRISLPRWRLTTA
jgi:hypothetical protein